LNGKKEFAKGSYAVIYKCHIVGVGFIPRDEEYACKAFINSVERNAATTMNIEAMSCPLVHPLFIKLFAIHPTKAHGYMRWWNAGTLRQMVNTCNKKLPTSPGVDQENVRMFQRLRIRLSWHFLHGMLFLYQNGSIHCDLSPDNILLHREGNNMYIGVCDWGFACRVDFPLQSNYQYGSQREMEADKLKRPWMDPTLMSLHGSELAKCSLVTDVYATSKLALWIIGYDEQEIGISKDLFEMYTTGLRNVHYAAPHERYDVLLKKIDTFQRSITMLKIDPIECYRKIEF
jgi:serine/threonine protein kinase